LRRTFVAYQEMNRYPKCHLSALPSSLHWSVANCRRSTGNSRMLRPVRIFAIRSFTIGHEGRGLRYSPGRCLSCQRHLCPKARQISNKHRAEISVPIQKMRTSATHLVFVHGFLANDGGFGIWMPGTGCWILDVGHWVLDAGIWNAHTVLIVRIVCFFGKMLSA